MKRVFFMSWLGAMTVVFGMLPGLAVAAATAPPAGGKSLTQTDSCVQIALPIFGNNTCVQNAKGNGGAVVVYLRDVLKLISGVVGITIITLIIWSGIQYITSMGDPGAVKGAKERLVNAITGLVLYLMMFAILQFLVPGGIL